MAALDGQTPGEDTPFAGCGPLLEEDDATVFQTVDGLVQRQELIALNHLAQDTYFTLVKMGFPWGTLSKDTARDRYTFSLPYGVSAVSIQAVPNKAWDAINKTTEALLVDFPQAECEPGDDSEEAEGACDLANRFLSQNADEQGTNDEALFWDRLQRSLTCASAYLECWTDPTGGGYVPLQIPAHPEAASPMQPLVGPDGMPTASPVLRYVTSVGPDGQPTEQSQFTTDPSQAAPQWQPKLMASKWNREHIRCYPETATVEQAEKVIVLGYCTISEAKRRWPSIAQMDPQDLTKLCDWTPVRFMALLPPFQRGRWKLTDGKDKQKAGSSDERILFYYHIFAKSGPEHKKGADVVVTGALDRFVIDRKLLSVEVECPPPAGDEPNAAQRATPPGAPVKETRCLEIPLIQLTPRSDPDEMDPTGRAYIEMIAGAVENNAHLAMSASEVIDKNLHLEGYAPSTSPVSGQQRENARAEGDIIPILRPEDVPKWGPTIPMDATWERLYELSDEAINSIGSTSRASKGLEHADEKSGKAIQLATANNNVSLGGMNTAVNNAYARWCRIKLERMMVDFTTSQQIAYVGDDGIFKQQDFHAMDFALIGKVVVKAGTGTLLNPDLKVQNLAGLAQLGLMSKDDAAAAAKPAYSRKLGLVGDPHEQRIERQITAFNKGPPEGWPALWQTFQQHQQIYTEQQQRAQALQTQTQLPGAPPEPVQTAVTPPVMPWTPFTPALPTDTEPAIAQIRQRRLGRLLDSAKFSAFPPEWQQVAIAAYQTARDVVSQSMAPPPQIPKGVLIQAKASDPASLAGLEAAAEGKTPPPQAPPAGGAPPGAPTGGPPAPAPHATPHVAPPVGLQPQLHPHVGVA